MKNTWKGTKYVSRGHGFVLKNLWIKTNLNLKKNLKLKSFKKKTLKCSNQMSYFGSQKYIPAVYAKFAY